MLAFVLALLAITGQVAGMPVHPHALVYGDAPAGAVRRYRVYLPLDAAAARPLAATSVAPSCGVRVAGTAAVGPAQVAVALEGSGVACAGEARLTFAAPPGAGAQQERVVRFRIAAMALPLWARDDLVSHVALRDPVPGTPGWTVAYRLVNLGSVPVTVRGPADPAAFAAAIGYLEVLDAATEEEPPPAASGSPLGVRPLTLAGGEARWLVVRLVGDGARSLAPGGELALDPALRVERTGTTFAYSLGGVTTRLPGPADE